MAEKKQPPPAAKAPLTVYIGTGRRKTAVARVRVTEGRGNIVINDRAVTEYFTEEKDRAAVFAPLKITDQLNRVDVTVKTAGGGITGQAGAVCQGLARALKTMFSPTSEQKRHVFGNTTVVKTYRDEKKERERAKAPVVRPAPTVPAAAALAVGRPAIQLVPTAPPPPPTDPAEIAIGMIKKLRDSGFLTRDARMKERKKYGLRGARRGTQFSKR
jgi:small subunit ribosomal protein S9